MEERINDEIIAGLSDTYSLPSQLVYAKIVPDIDRFTTEDRVRVFEAYVGGLSRESGYSVIKDWVGLLMDWDNM